MDLKRRTLKEIIELHVRRELVGVFNLSNNDYHAAPGLSKSALDNIAESPKYYRHKLNNPSGWTKDLIIGSAYHCQLLEDEPFSDLFYLSKTQPQDPKLDEKGRLPLSEANNELILQMRKEFYAHKNAPRLIQGYRELSFFWTDPQTGILCKCKPDCVLKSGMIVDLKTAADVSESSLSKAIFERRYNVQGAFFIDGVKAALAQAGQDLGLEKEPDTFILCAQEKKDAFDIICRPVGPNTIVQGEELYRKDLETYVKCVQSDMWPGKAGPADFIEIESPIWSFR